MKFSMIFKIDKPVLPVDYRSGFISLLKCSYQKASEETYSKLYEEYNRKQFTFSVYFGNKSKIQDKKININSDRIILNFSTSSMELGTHFYNGLLKIKKELKEYPLFDSKISLEKVNLQRESQINQDRVVFKTLSPFLVRDYKDKNKYLKLSDEGFTSQLKHIVSECAKTFLNNNSAVEFEDIKTTTIPVYHNLGNAQNVPPIDAIKGIFALEGNPEVLNLIYQIGLGSRCSQGFGMLEVVG